MIVSDGASDDDIASGYAITGYQEERMRQLVDFRWDESYRTALIKERINLNNVKQNEPLVTDQYKQILGNEIKTVNPNVIVPLSELSFNFVAGLTGIYKFRGSVLPARSEFPPNTKVIPVLGLYPYLNQDPKMTFISRLDFSKVAKNIDNPIPFKDENVWIIKTAIELLNYIERGLKTCEFLVFDIETFYSIPTCISLCFNDDESATVPLLDNRISVSERGLMMKYTADLLASSTPKVNQNIKFDWKKLNRFKYYVNNIVGDTLLAASCLYCEFPKNLGFLTSIYTDMPYFKDEGKQFDPTIHNRDRLYLYCAKDSLATHRIYTQQQKELEETNTKYVYNKLIEILPIYKRMEERGILIDATARDRLTSKYETLFNIQVYKIRSLINNDEFNPLSSIQCGKLVYDELKCKAVQGVKRTKAGNPSTDEESLELVMWMGDNGTRIDEIIQTLINIRKVKKTLEYLETPLHMDGRLRCEFNLAGSENGRTTASTTTDSFFYFEHAKKNIAIKSLDLGRSFQTIAKHGFEIDGEEYGKELREIFVPSPGYCFVECDLSQAEARVDAVLAADYDFLPVFDGPIGIHRLTGSWIFNKAPEEIKKGTREYHEAKTARHAGERNMTEKRLMMMIHRPMRDCINILKLFHNKQPNIRGIFHEDVKKQLQTNKCLVAPNGRRRDFFGRFDKDQINEGISFLPQAIVTDYLKNGLERTFTNFNQAEPLSEAHDGFLAEVPIEIKETYAGEFKRNTEVEIDFETCSLKRDYRLRIPAEAEWSKDNWMNMEPLHI